MRNAKRPALVLSDESARHPFLAKLPAHVRAQGVLHDPRPLWKITAEDARGFATAYLACLVAILAFII